MFSLIFLTDPSTVLVMMIWYKCRVAKWFWKICSWFVKIYLITPNVSGHVFSTPGIKADSQTKFVKVRILTRVETLDLFTCVVIRHGFRTKNLNTRYLSTISFVFLQENGFKFTPYLNIYLRITLKLLGVFDMKICSSLCDWSCKNTPRKIGLRKAAFFKIQN